MAAIDGLSHLLKCANAFPDTMMKAEMDAANSVGWEVKRAWLGIMAANGMRVGGNIAGKPWNVRDNARQDKKFGTVSTRVRFVGPVHLAISPTKSHMIGAKHLGTKSSFAKVSKGVSARAAFGGSSRGVFGTLRTTAKSKGVIVDRKGARALHIAGTTWRAYAFHQGTDGKPVWNESKAIAFRIAPSGFAPARRDALIAAGFGQAAGLGKAVAK